MIESPDVSAVGHISRAQDRASAIAGIYATLDAAYGAHHWHWMPDVASPTDIIVGAVLVQHTTWQSAERALHALRDARALDVRTLASMGEDEIATLIRVCGTPSVKARRLRALCATIIAAGDLDAFLALPLDAMRSRLLMTHGVGPETADAIMLYAANHPAFVVDAYTRRLFGRLSITPASGDTYGDWRRMFEDALCASTGSVAEAGAAPQTRERAAGRRLAATYQRYHAWIVLHAKEVCRVRPRCDGCVLRGACPSATGIR